MEKMPFHMSLQKPRPASGGWLRPFRRRRQRWRTCSAAPTVDTCDRQATELDSLRVAFAMFPYSFERLGPPLLPQFHIETKD